MRFIVRVVGAFLSGSFIVRMVGAFLSGCVKQTFSVGKNFGNII